LIIKGNKWPESALDAILKTPIRPAFAATARLPFLMVMRLPTLRPFGIGRRMPIAAKYDV
jgi:hypothetical protein